MMRLSWVNATLYSLKVSCPVRPKLSYDLAIDDWNSTYTVRVWGAEWVERVEAWLPLGRITGHGDIANVTVDGAGVRRVELERGSGDCSGVLCLSIVNKDANVTGFDRKEGRNWDQGPTGPPNASLVLEAIPDGCFTVKFEMLADDQETPNLLSELAWHFGDAAADGPNIDLCFESNDLISLATAVPPDDDDSTGPSLNWIIVLVACLALVCLLGMCGCVFACPMLSKLHEPPPPTNQDPPRQNPRVLQIEKWSTAATKDSISSPTAHD